QVVNRRGLSSCALLSVDARRQELRNLFRHALQRLNAIEAGLLLDIRIVWAKLWSGPTLLSAIASRHKKYFGVAARGTLALRLLLRSNDQRQAGIRQAGQVIEIFFLMKSPNGVAGAVLSSAKQHDYSIFRFAGQRLAARAVSLVWLAIKGR